MLNSFRGTKHPVTKSQRFELMFNRKMRIGSVPNPVSQNKTAYEVQENDRKYKEKSMKYFDKRHKVKEFDIKVGDHVLFKNKRTDRLLPWLGRVTGIRKNSVTAEFDNGKVRTRDKSHFKVVNEVFGDERERESQVNSRNEGQLMEFITRSSDDEVIEPVPEVVQPVTSETESADRPGRNKRKNPRYFNEDFVNN